jgi:hypothetical protein
VFIIFFAGDEQFVTSRLPSAALCFSISREKNGETTKIYSKENGFENRKTVAVIAIISVRALMAGVSRGEKEFALRYRKMVDFVERDRLLLNLIGAFLVLIGKLKAFLSHPRNESSYRLSRGSSMSPQKPKS